MCVTEKKRGIFSTFKKKKKSSFIKKDDSEKDFGEKRNDNKWKVWKEWNKRFKHKVENYKEKIKKNRFLLCGKHTKKILKVK